MSDAPAAGGVAERARSLPLFPLRTVLFPGGLLPLKVFEHRYVEMIKACLREERPFGVCLIVEGDEVSRGDGTMPRIANVGTLARITDVDIPQLGILHVATVGGTRFGSRKKNAMKSATRKRNPATYQNPSAADAAASTTGTTI